MPHHKSCEKRLKTAAKERQANRAVRSSIRNALKKIRAAETKADALSDMPRLFSIMDKAALKGRAGFSRNRVANYKSKISAVIAKLA